MSEHPVSEVFREHTELEATLDQVDRDGAFRETSELVFALTRGQLLRRSAGAVAAGAAAYVGLSDRDARAAAGMTKNDVAILQFDQVLEALQAGLYTEAERLGALKPVVKSPAFNYGDVTSDESAFLKTTVAFEDLTSALLKWQAPRLDSREIVAAAVSLHSVETRHAAWIRHVIGLQPAATAFDKPASQQKMAQLIDSTNFVVSRPKTVAKKKPRFTG